MNIIMIKNNKKSNKNIKYMLTIICIVIISFGIIVSSNLMELKDEVFLNVNATPITNKTIIIDAGHGLPDSGATAVDNTSEEELALSITLKLQNLIEQSGANVVLTRSDENGIYSLDSESISEKKVSDIKNRVLIGNSSSADVFISIHLNIYPASDVYKGWQTFYQGGSEESIALATFIQNNISSNIDIENDRVPHEITDVYIMNNVTIPSVIVECGFLSNESETELLKTDEYQNQLAWGIYLGIQEYFN